jgi:hypothetical protein
MCRLGMWWSELVLATQGCQLLLAPRLFPLSLALAEDVGQASHLRHMLDAYHHLHLSTCPQSLSTLTPSRVRLRQRTSQQAGSHPTS